MNSAMSLDLEDWKWDPLADSESDKWLLMNDENLEKEVHDPSSKKHSSITHEISNFFNCDISESKYWLEEFPLFEEIEALEDTKIPVGKNSSLNGNLKSDNEKLSFDQLNASEYCPHPCPVQEFFASSIENTTLFFSNNNVVYIKGNSHVDMALLNRGEEHVVAADQKKLILLDEPKSQKSPMNTIEENLLSAIVVPNIPLKSEVAAVDEILRNAAMELDHWETDTDTSFGSPATSESPGSSSNQEDESDDPEWSPNIKSSNSQKLYSKPAKVGKGGRGRRGRSEEDKQLRKKEQNKCAATRYRLKKKAEVYEILKKEEELKKTKTKLEEKLSEIRNETKCLKGLMRDLFKAKGLI